MGARLTTALLAGRAASLLSRRLGLGGGTVISGHVVPLIAPDALRTISSRLPHGTVVVSGTNGKTTTSRLAAHLLRRAGLRILHNRAGANLLAGLVAAVVDDSSLNGSPRADVGLFEVDEATLPAAVREVAPQAVVLTNIFRDQLDRYGEVDVIAELWRRALAGLPAHARVALNADDPLVASLGSHVSGHTMYFGIADLTWARQGLEHAADARLCLACGARYLYEASFYGHLGHYRCPCCSVRRPDPDVAAIRVASRGLAGTDLEVATPGGLLRATLPLPGLYNVYNALAAICIALGFGASLETIADGLAEFRAAFGRLERVEVNGRQLFLALVKNPAGFNQVLRMLADSTRDGNFLILINDLFADGTDISWLWDVDFEIIAGIAKFVVCSGLRAEDMAVRLKYALVPQERIHVESEPGKALEMALHLTPPGETIYVLPTYTAMLEVRHVLRKAGYVVGFWQD